MSSQLNTDLPSKVELTQEQKYAMDAARIGFMSACPFFCYYFYSEMTEYPTLAIPSAATDGRRLFYNPVYLASLKPGERIFVLAHEVYHAVSKHPVRMKNYGNDGNLRGYPWYPQIFNVAADFVINADLIQNQIGSCNGEWLYNPSIKSSDLVEDIYEKLIKQGAGPDSAPTYGQGKKGLTRPDKTAEANGGRFDEVLPPRVDPVTGKEDKPGDGEFKEAIARAAAAAKAIGKMPDTFKRMVEEILEPQISWREHIRMLVTGHIGARHETWSRPNRRRLALSASTEVLTYLPGRRGYGADTVVVPVDTSGSISDKELSAFFAEIGGVLADVRPRRILVIWCDARVHRVDEVASLQELDALRIAGDMPGGGGTDFRPPFKYIEENNIRPQALIYLTDMYGPFPKKKPDYPVVWCSTSKDHEAPFGDVVEIST